MTMLTTLYCRITHDGYLLAIAHDIDYPRLGWSNDDKTSVVRLRIPGVWAEEIVGLAEDNVCDGYKAWTTILDGLIYLTASQRLDDERDT